MYQSVLERLPACRLLVVGDFEPGDRVPQPCVEYLKGHPQVIVTGFVDNPELYYHLMQVLVLPTHREGFGNVLLEAAVAEVPTVAFRTTGTVDAVEDGVTGSLVSLGDVPALTEAVMRYMENSELRRSHGRAGHDRVLRCFRSELVWDAVYNEYLRLLGQNIASTCKTDA